MFDMKITFNKLFMKGRNNESENVMYGGFSSCTINSNWLFNNAKRNRISSCTQDRGR